MFTIVCHVRLAVASGATVSVTCTSPEAPGFSIDLTATAPQDDEGCLSSDRKVTNITINTRPTVDVQAPGNSSVCITGNDTSTQLLFTVSSTNGEAAVTPAVVTGQANCTADTTTVSK